MLLLACDGFVGDVSVQRASAPALYGEWNLASVNGSPPSILAIQSWTIHFRRDGTWSYSGTMTGRLSGMSVSGAGTWHISRSGSLEYTAGATQGHTAATILGSTLWFGADPVLATPGGGGSVTTTYRRGTA